jgi:hypothetical protein
MNWRLTVLVLATFGAASVKASELRVPASTAYLAPNPEGARVWGEPKTPLVSAVAVVLSPRSVSLSNRLNRCDFLNSVSFAMRGP